MLNLVIAHPLYCCVICAKPLPARLGYDHNANGQRIERRGYMGCLWMVQTPVPTLAMATLGGMEITKALTRLKGLENDPVFMLLHGWGSNEYDLPDLLNYCGAGSADYASLQAPIAYGMGYTWFGSWAHEGVPEGKSLDEQALAAAQAIDAWVGANIPATRPIVMMAFRRADCWPPIYCDSTQTGTLQPYPVQAGWHRAPLPEMHSSLRCSRRCSMGMARLTISSPKPMLRQWAHSGVSTAR